MSSFWRKSFLILENMSGIFCIFVYKQILQYFMSGNPFISGLYDVRKRTKSKVVSKSPDLVVDADGEVKSGHYMAIIKESQADVVNFIKLYPNALGVISNLSSAGVKVLCYIMSIISFRDYIIFDVAEALEFTGYKSVSAIYKGLDELKKLEFIADHKRRGLFYVNPLYFYRGNRLSLIRKAVRDE